MGSHFLTMTGKKESTFKTGTSSILLTYANFIAGWVGMSLHWLPPTKVRFGCELGIENPYDQDPAGLVLHCTSSVTSAWSNRTLT